MKETKITISNKTVKVDLPNTEDVGDLSEVPGKPKSVLYHPTLKQLMLGEGGGGDVAFDGNREITAAIPGLQGRTVGGTTLVEFWNNALFPSLAPVFTSFYADNSTRLFGASTSVTLHWSVQARTSPIATIDVNGVQIDPAETSGVVGGAADANTNTRFYATVTSEAGETVNVSTDVAFAHHRYWFQASENLLTLFPDDADLSADVRVYQSREFSGSRAQPLRIFDLADEYVYFAYPASFGTATFEVGGLPNTAYQTRAFQFTNEFGYTEPYYLYRSGGRGTGEAKVKLN